MKARTLILIAVVAILSTSCRYVHQIKDMVEDIVNLPVTSENVAKRAETLGSDAVLLASVADTQYVLFRQGRQVFKKEHAYRCYVMRYVKTGDNEWSARVIQSQFDEPEQPVVMTRNADNALTLTVDSLVISIADIVATDSTLTFDFGIDNPDRAATLYLFGKARKMKDPFAETSIQHMLSMALIMDELMEDSDCEIDTVEELEIPGPTEAPDMDVDNAAVSACALTYAERYAAYSRMDSLAVALGFNERSATAEGDYIKLEAKKGSRKAKKCYESMEQMGKAAAESHCRVWRVNHTPNHRNCKFTIEW